MKGIKLIIEEKENYIDLIIEEHRKKLNSKKYEWAKIKRIIIDKEVKDKVDVKVYNIGND